jgi:hypothetical protein
MRWEYHREFFDPFDEHDARVEQKSLAVLNELGRDGWEVVAMYPYSRHSNSAVVLLKRQSSENADG